MRKIRMKEGGGLKRIEAGEAGLIICVKIKYYFSMFGFSRP